MPRNYKDTDLEVSELQKRLWATEAKLRTMVDHITMLRSPQVTHDAILHKQLDDCRRELARLKTRYYALEGAPKVRVAKVAKVA